MDRRHRAELLGDRAWNPQAEIRTVPSEGSDITFVGYGSTTENDYDMGWHVERIAHGAFRRTLGQNPDVSFLINHDGQPYARSTNGSLGVREDDIGLAYEARVNAERYPSVREPANAVEDGLYTQCSFAFRVVDQEWNDDCSLRTIKEVNLNRGDVSVVTNGANPDTPVSVSMRDVAEKFHLPTADVFAEALSDLRAGSQLSDGQLKALQGVLDLIDASDTNVDKALISLSSFMGVTNPDIAQDEALDRSGELDLYLALADAARLRALSY